jgi:hypothetical protein
MSSVDDAFILLMSGLIAKQDALNLGIQSSADRLGE